MKIKRDCGCGAGGKHITNSLLNDYLFFVIQQANINGKDRAIVIEGEEVTDYQLNIAMMLRKNIVSVVKVGLNNVSEININREILLRA